MLMGRDAIDLNLMKLYKRFLTPPLPCRVLEPLFPHDNPPWTVFNMKVLLIIIINYSLTSLYLSVTVLCVDFMHFTIGDALYKVV